MQKPSGSQDDPRPRHRIALVALGTILVLGTAFACSSNDDFVTFGGGATDDGGVGPSFTAPDSGEAGTTPAPAVEAGLCITSECPAPYASCLTYAGVLPSYACETDTSNDVLNCGACGHQCPGGADSFHFKAGCVGGQCQPFCREGYTDCNGLPDDGCESEPKTDPANCGICGNACPAGVACIEGRCGCPPGMTDCGGACVDLANDDGSCGACALKCVDHQPADAGTVPPHMFYGCKQGQCTDLRCSHSNNDFWADCNGSIHPDGCEVNLAKPNRDNCGACGNTCDPTQQCFSSSDTGMDCQCKGGKFLCPAGEYSPPECADLENDPRNCGSCGYVCPTVDGADITCSHGRCSFECKPGTADCNGRSDDGCEVDLGKDPRSCGTCGTTCDVARGQPCVGGQCVTVDCDAGPVK